MRGFRAIEKAKLCVSEIFYTQPGVKILAEAKCAAWGASTAFQKVHMVKIQQRTSVRNRRYANLRDNYQRVFHFLFTKSFVLPKNTKQCNGLP